MKNSWFKVAADATVPASVTVVEMLDELLLSEHRTSFQLRRDNQDASWGKWRR